MEVQLSEDVKVVLSVTPHLQSNSSTVRVTGLFVRYRYGTFYSNCWLVGDIRVDEQMAANLVLTNTRACSVAYGNAWSGGGEDTWSGYSCQDVEVPHSSDGTAQPEIAVSLRIFTTTQQFVENLDRTGTVQLPAIPRASTLTAQSAPLGQPITLTLTRAVERFRDTVCWSCGTEGGCLAEGTDARILEWTPPIALAAQSPAADTVQVTFTVTTFSGDTPAGSSRLELSCPIPAEVVPSAGLALADRTGYLQTHGGYIQNQSQLQVRVTAAGVYGSTVAGICVRCGSLTGTGEEVCFALERSGTVTVTAEVTDSRGRCASISREITVLPYAPPAPRVERAFRCDGAGNEQADGEYLCIAFTARLTPVENGTARYHAITRVRGGTQTRRVELTACAGEFQAEGSIVLPAGVDSGYDCLLEAQDSFSTVLSDAVPVGVAFVLLDFHRDRRSAGIGMRAQGQQRLSIGMDADFTGHRLTGLAAPQSPADAATKEYVDTLLATLTAQLSLP